MKKIALLSILASSLLFSSNLAKEGINVKYTDSEDEDKEILVKRIKDKNCSQISFSPKTVLGGDYASKEVPKNCKKTFVTSYGSISAIKFSKDVETYGELEVLEFIKKAQKNENMLLVDSRTQNWYLQKTIPSAINIPFIFLNKSQYPDDFAEVLDTIGVKKTKNGYDFSEAKELLLFCNGAWCGQSPESMKKLIEIGYPQNKLKWYRGGIQSWLSFNLPSIEP